MPYLYAERDVSEIRGMCGVTSLLRKRALTCATATSIAGRRDNAEVRMRHLAWAGLFLHIRNRAVRSKSYSAASSALPLYRNIRYF